MPLPELSEVKSLVIGKGLADSEFFIPVIVIVSVPAATDTAFAA